MQQAPEVFSERLIPVALIVGAVVLGLTPAAMVVNYVFAPAALTLGLFLFYRRSTAYVSFTMWIWMLTPLVRRIVDFSTGFHPVSPVMTAPLLVTSISLLSLFSSPRGGRGAIPLAYIAYVAVVIVGLIVGAPSAGLPAAFFDLLNWTLPAAFAVHLMRVSVSTEQTTIAMFKSLAFGSLVTGLYGILQFFLLPGWDAAWMLASGLESIGAPFAREVRVFSTLNSPGPFAEFVSAGVIVLFTWRFRLRWFAITVGAISLLLSLVRASWGGCAIGLLLTIALSPVRAKRQNVLVATFTTGAVAIILAFTPIGETVLQRADTLSNAGSDASFLQRQALYSRFSDEVLGSVLGQGLGHTGIAGRNGENTDEATSVIDSGLIEMLFSFGVLGLVMMVSVLSVAIRSFPNGRSLEATTSYAIAMSSLSSIAFGNVLIGSQGMLVLPFFALAAI